MVTNEDAMTLPEYARNPFIAKLPSLKTQKAMYKDLLAEPLFDERECEYPPHLRKHCIARLAKCFLPQARQVELADRFSLLLRQGYLGRDPLTHDYLRHLHNGIERIEGKSLEAKVSQPVKNTASSFALLGCPGVGKTLAVNRVLDQYPQTIQHDTPFSLIQIVWLRLEAPALGSLKQLCLDFFQSIDTLIGTDYVKRYAIGTSVEQMLVHMAHLAHLHALGVLVIDEIQHLRGAKVGAEPLMKFLVKLVNTIGVPVVPIGTLGALPILQGSFSQARRSTGLGSLLWDRMEPGLVWNQFIGKLWKYQWTYPRTDLTDELNAAIYDESQGVADLAVKLFMLAQLRLVGISEMRKGMSELLTPALIRTVAKEEFAMVAPMIQALRTNDPQDLKKYDDLRSLSDHIGIVLGRALNGYAAETTAASTPAFPGAAPAASHASIDELLLSSLTSLGVAEDVARQLVGEALAKEPSGDPLMLMGRMTATLAASPPKLKRSKAKHSSTPELPQDDLRRLMRAGKEKGQSAYQTLLEAGVVRPPMLDFAA
ncbi:ATP-binding protein [Pseudoxanthomonas mexicana]|uniref:ATP-binding protein n=1 Tax=Pseudoxanthomonas mexicana TaxID=128785 RepID=UPI0022F39A50|nr:ATP-binding protein [Pseudoxanthomonas mexicana]WBX95215.1 ATP-binding protein [Pseudoxanthomonas mexicana]